MILNMSWTTPYKGEVKTLHLKRDPFMHGLGVYEDTNGVRWDVKGLRGGERRYVTARRVECHPGYYTTATGGVGAGGQSCGDASTETGPSCIHTWNPYYVEVSP